MSRDEGGIPVKAIAILAGLVLGGILLLVSVGKMVTTVAGDEIVLKQGFLSGEITCWSDPGPKMQNWGHLTTYKKSAQFWFSAMNDQGKTDDQSIKIRFNDKAEGHVSGSLRFELPFDCTKLKAIRERWASQEAIELQLIRTVVERAVNTSGPLMSSQESAAEKRNDLIQYIEDQVANGVYRQETEDVKVTDQLSGKEKTVTRVKLVKDPGQPNGIARQERSPLAEFGIKTYNLSINGIKYTETVERQFAEQQQALMRVQTAMAEAKQAEQRAITLEKEGQANAAKAKWDQEVNKATAVTRAEQEKAVALLEASKKREVAELAVQTADLYKREQTLMGEGDAARRRAVMAADGALDARLKAQIEINKLWAAEVGKQKWVPDVQIGGSGGSAANPVTGMMDLLQVRFARDVQEMLANRSSHSK